MRSTACRFAGNLISKAMESVGAAHAQQQAIKLAAGVFGRDLVPTVLSDGAKAYSVLGFASESTPKPASQACLPAGSAFLPASAAFLLAQPRMFSASAPDQGASNAKASDDKSAGSAEGADAASKAEESSSSSGAEGEGGEQSREELLAALKAKEEGMGKLTAQVSGACMRTDASHVCCDGMRPTHSITFTARPMRPDPVHACTLQVEKLTDALKRSLADMENLRVRTAKEVDNAKKFALQVGGGGRRPAHASCHWRLATGHWPGAVWRSLHPHCMRTLLCTSHVCIYMAGDAAAGDPCSTRRAPCMLRSVLKQQPNEATCFEPWLRRKHS